MANQRDPRLQYNIPYGPNTNCTLSICPIQASVYQYRPTLPGNAIFIVIFGLIGIIQTVQMLRYKAWWFGGSMILGCVSEMMGYGGRIILYHNPFSFNGFLLQIICITWSPVFYTAAIYFTLSKIVVILDPSYSRFPPKYFYYIFLTSDVVSLVLQASGGGSSSTSSGKSQIGVNVSLAGLSFQVFSLLVFIGLCIDYLIRYSRGTGKTYKDLTKKGKIFAVFLSIAIVLILARCCYRIAELHQGYAGALIHDEPLFIVMEGVVIVLAAICLCIAHPGFVFGRAGDLSSKPAHHQNASELEKAMPEGSSTENVAEDKLGGHTNVAQRV